MQKYLVASVYRDQGDEGTPTFCDPQIVWGESTEAACEAGRYPNSTDREGRLWGAPEALAVVNPDGSMSYLTRNDTRMVDEAKRIAIDYTDTSGKQKYLVASVYLYPECEGVPCITDPQIVWGVTSKLACEAGRYPNGRNKEGELLGTPTALAIVNPDGGLSYLTHYASRMVDETYNKAIDYTKEAAASWDIEKFIERISKEPGPKGHWLRNHLTILGNAFIKTRINISGVEELIVANQGWLFCGDVMKVAPEQQSGVDWRDVTDEMVSEYIDKLVNSLYTHESYKALHWLSSIKYDDTSLERQKALLECMEKLLPDSVEAFTEGPVVNVPIAERLMLMKSRMLEHIANL